MKYEHPEATLLPSAIDAIQTSSDTFPKVEEPMLDSINEESASAYLDWE
jgi:hypothetical protein